MKPIGEMMRSKTQPPVRPRRIDADEKTIFFLAEKVVLGLYGVRGRENIVPRYWKGGKLFFSCQSPLWANELWITRESLSDKINQELGSDIIKEIKVSE
jgi:hypothetical protein